MGNKAGITVWTNSGTFVPGTAAIKITQDVLVISYYSNNNMMHCKVVSGCFHAAVKSYKRWQWDNDDKIYPISKCRTWISFLHCNPDSGMISAIPILSFLLSRKLRQECSPTKTIIWSENTKLTHCLFNQIVTDCGEVLPLVLLRWNPGGFGKSFAFERIWLSHLLAWVMLLA